jgi:hypothetical protein
VVLANLHFFLISLGGLIKSDKNYPALKLEFLAMKWAICDKFKNYLFGNTFRVLTDNNPQNVVQMVIYNLGIL